MKVEHWFGLVVVALATAMVANVGTLALAQDSDVEEGQIIRIGPDQNDNVPEPNVRGERRLRQPGFPERRGLERRRPARVASPYWIGLVGGPVSPALRYHLDIPEDTGLMVMEVVPEGPADEGGLKKYDIMLRAGDVDLNDMSELVDLVNEEGDRQGQVAIEVMRRGQRETVWVTPEDRPADAVSGLPQLPGQGFERGPGDVFGQLFQQFDHLPDGGLEGRHVGPGVALGWRQNSFAQLPNGASVKVEKESGEPVKVTVERDGEVWEIEGDDPEALDQLPEDLRPYVEQTIQGPQALKFDFRGLQENMPQLQEQFEEWGPAMGEAGMNLLDRVQEMEEQMRQLQQRFQNPPAEETTDADQVH